jgi:hypothetical protein
MDGRVDAFTRELEAPRPKLTFIVKLHKILTFTSQSPATICSIGLTWTSDNESIVSNSKILGQFLNLRANSVNTNFREHGFQHPEVMRSEKLIWYVPALRDQSIPEIGHWKRRKHVQPFNRFLTNTQIVELDALSRHLFNERPNSRFVDAAQGQWQTAVGSAATAPLQALIRALVPGQGDRIETIRVNLTHLLSREMDIRSLMTGEVSFNAFLRLFLRYGSPAGFVEQLDGVTLVDFACSGSVPSFENGMCFGMDRRLFAESWARAPPKTWALMEGEEEGTLKLIIKS